VPQAAIASRSPDVDAARTYVAARAAALSGDHARSAQLLAELVEASAANDEIKRRAISEAIGAGAMSLAIRLTQELPSESLPIDARLLLAAEELRRGKGEAAVAHLTAKSDSGTVAFLTPVVEAWIAADDRDLKTALATLDKIGAGSPLYALAAEHRALILLKFKRSAEADAFARQAIEKAGGREHRLRLALADAFMAAGDRKRALGVVEGLGTEVGRARERVLSGKPSGVAIDNASKAFSELILGLAVDLNRMRNRALPVALAQVARYAAPGNSSAAILLGVFLESRGRVDDALQAFRSVRPENALSAQARDAEVLALVDADRVSEALAVAHAAASSKNADISDYARLGDALEAADRFDEAAAAYGRAIALSANNRADERWPLLLLQASAFEQADRWPEARQALGAALALAPNEPLILNFLGYAKLERGEDLDAAEAMIRRASALAPDDASITDSLGWALYKRGRFDQAIETLQRAARGDPGQAEIHEHLGDALYSAGRKFEARFAWRAALATAEEDVAGRIQAKIEAGLTPATAAP
jgi:tetratricopeptide (TPR) repeat protein